MSKITSQQAEPAQLGSLAYSQLWTGRIAPKLPLFRKAIDLRKTTNLRKTVDLYRTRDLYKTINFRQIFNIRRTPNIRKILPPLDNYSGTYGVSKVCKDKANRPVLDIEEVTILLSINVKA